MDVICQAKSGMGKTAVFVLATLQQIETVDGKVNHNCTFKEFLNSNLIEASLIMHITFKIQALKLKFNTIPIDRT